MKGNVTLSDGREIEVDISTLTQREFRSFFDPTVADKTTDTVVGRITGLKVKEVGDLLRDDYRRVMNEIVRLANRPLTDPNSQSESITE